MKRHQLFFSVLLLILVGMFFIIIIKSSQNAVLELFKKEARAFLTVVALSQENSLFAEANLEGMIIDNLINLINALNDIGISRNNLEQFCKNFNLKSMVVLNSRTKGIVAQSGDPIELVIKKTIPEDKMSFHYFTFRDEKFIRFIYKIKNYLIQIEISADVVRKFSQEFGISRILNELSASPAVKYLALQDTKGIILASPGVKQLTRIESDTSLMKVIAEKTELIRIADFEGEKILEIAEPFVVDGKTLGIFRIGMNLNLYYNYIRTSNIQLFSIFAILSFTILLLIFLYLRYERTFNLTELFSGILGTIEEGVLFIDRKKRITGVNRRFCSFVGTSESKVRQKNYKEIFADDPFSIEDTLRDGTTIEEEKNLFGKILSFTTYPVFDSKKEITGVITIVRDMTQIREIEKEKREREHLQFLGNLVANFAHEIKNPLNGLAIAVQRLNKEFSFEDPEYRLLISILDKEIDSLNRVVNDFLSLVRPVIKEKCIFNLSQLIKDITLFIREQARKKGVTIRENIEENIEFLGNEGEIKRAVLNIILNAMEAVPEMTGEIKVSLRKEKKGLLIEIKDNGPGIPPEIQKRIFEPYFTTRTGGTGLGLYIAHRIIKDHDGIIMVGSTPEQGSTFTINLPCRD
ncbi:MAG: ATP-binding protein [candidate division WOR-3 bacterium]